MTTETATTRSDPDRPGPLRSPHFAHFESLRAIAVTSVLCLHVGSVSATNQTGWLGLVTSQGKLGVQIFFVISGFLLYRPWALAALADLDGPSLRTYARRRVLRIVPAYWVALTFLAVWPGLRGVFTSDWWVYYGLLQGYRFRTWLGGIGPAWSLSLEAAFYAVLPLLAWALARAGSGCAPRTRLRFQVGVLAILALASQLFQAWVRATGQRSLQLVLPSMFECFAAGMALALASAWLGEDERRSRGARWVADRPAWIWGAAAAVFALGCLSPAFVRTGMIDPHTPLTHAGERLLHSAIAVLIVLPAVFGEARGGWPRRFLASPTLQWLGRISYGVFLWHFPLLIALEARGAAGWIPGWRFLSMATVGVPLALLCGWASYRLVEIPAMRWR